MLLKDNSILIMTGDSVTDCERDYNSINSYGNGYVNLVNAFLTSCYPDKKISVINKGINGNTILDLEKRLYKDIESLNPDYVTIMIGINDVWRQFDSVLIPNAEFSSKDEFYNRYTALVNRLKIKVKKLFILSPFMIIETKDHPMRKLSDEYGLIAKKVAIENDITYIDIQEKFDKFTDKLSSYILSCDHIHPNTTGHSIIAKAFLDEIEFEY